jgi:hypothetical protein
MVSSEVLEIVRRSPTGTCTEPARFSPPSEGVIGGSVSPRFLLNLLPGVIAGAVDSLNFFVPLLDGAVALRLSPVAPPDDSIVSAPGERGVKSSKAVSAGGRYITEDEDDSKGTAIEGQRVRG